MAIRIPTIDAPRVSSTAMPTPFESTNVSPGGLAGLASQALGEGAKLELKAKNEADSQSFLEAQNSFRAFNDSGLEQIRRAEGKNAAIVANKFYEEADKKAKEIWGGLVNEDQKRAFSNAANSELAQLKKIGEVHVGEQIKAADAMEFHGANALSLKHSNDNATVPGIAEYEAAEAEKRIFGYNEKGVHVSGYADRKGMSKEAALALRDQQVGIIYASKAETLLGLGDLRGALDVVQAHSKELGENAITLRGKVETMARHARADEKAAFLAQKYALPEGTFDLTRATSEADSMHPSGLERDALRAALVHREEQAQAGRRAVDAAHWEAGLGAYQNTGRSVAAILKTKEWADLTPSQRERLMDREEADRKEKENQPLTRDQMRALGRLQNDIIDRPSFWGTAENSVLDQNADFNILPEKYRVHLTQMVAQTHQDKQNPVANLQNAFGVMRSKAQENGILNRKKTATQFDKWPEEDQQNWSVLQDKVGPMIAAWHADPANKGKRIPNAVVEGFVDDATRKGSIKSGSWVWMPGFGFLSKSGVSPEAAAARPQEEQRLHPFTPSPYGGEEDLGRKVLERQGYKAEEMTPEKIIGAARLARDVSAGPGPQEREAIVKALRAAGAKDPRDQALIQQAYEKKRLKYVR